MLGNGPGRVEKAFMATSNDWQKAVVARYPKVGVAGSKENLAFLKAYSESGGTPETAMEIAETLAALHWEPLEGSTIRGVDFHSLAQGDKDAVIAKRLQQEAFESRFLPQE